MQDAGGGDEDLNALSLEDRLASKNWKARSHAYNQLITSFRTSVSEDALEFKPYLRDPVVLRDAILDSNAVAQEKGVEVACAFIEFGGKPAASKAREAFVSALHDKGLWGATRAGTKKFSIELCLLLVECDDSADAVLEGGLLDGLKSKQPKAVAGAVTTLKEIIRQFGAKTVNVKPFLKAIPAIFSHPDKGVRAEGTLLVQELHRWLGAALDPHLAELKPVQVKELSESFAGEEKAEQTRFTRTQQRERAVKEAEASLVGATITDEGPTNELDAHEEDADLAEDHLYDLTDPVALLEKLPVHFYDLLTSAKWKERKEGALEPLLDTLKKSPKILDASYDELVRALAGRMTDANIVCVIAAANCIEYMAKGLKTSFAKYKPIVIAPVLERCKEKKQSVVDALAAALDATFTSVSISDIVEDIATFAKHKNPQVKEQTYKWLIRSLSITRQAPNLKTDLKPLTDSLKAGLEDSFEPVRTAAAEGLGTLIKVLGPRPMASAMEGLDDIRRNKIEDFAEKAQVRCKPGLTGQAVPKKPPMQTSSGVATRAPVGQAKPLSSSPTDEKENRQPPIGARVAKSPPPTPKAPNGPSARPLAKKPPVLSSASNQPKKVLGPAAASKAATSVVQKTVMNEPLKFRMTQEEAEAQVEGAIPTEILGDLGNSNWKLRLAAIEALQSWTEANGQGMESEMVVRLLSKKPGWKESNFQVYGKMANLFQSLSTGSTTWTRACAALTIAPLSDKLGDIKLKKPAGDALGAYAEKYSLQFVLSTAYEAMTKQKAPKAQADGLLWIDQSLRDFGIQGIAIRDLIEFLKTGLKSSNASVRTSATKTLVTLRLYVGTDIKTFLQDLNPTLLSTIESEFDKVSSETAPTPTRQSEDNAVIASPANGGLAAKAAGRGGSDPLDDLFPRQELEKLIPGAVIAACGDANWKSRKEALEQVQGILEANKRLKPGLGEIGPALKLRLADSNKMVQGLALDAISRIAAGMNKPFEKHARLFIGLIATILADGKANVRAPATAALSAIFEHCGLDCMLTGIAAGLEVANPIQRKELAIWLGDKLQEGTNTSDLSILVGPTIACLEDKSAEVRKAAQALIPLIIAAGGYQALLDKAQALKPASRSAVLPQIEQAKGTTVSKAASVKIATQTETQPRPQSSASTNAVDSVSAPFQKSVTRALSVTGRALKPPSSAVPTAATSRSATPVETASVITKPTATRKPASNLLGNMQGPASRSASSLTELPFLSSDPSAKQLRGAKETGPLRWFIDTTARPDQIDYLHHQMKGHASDQIIALLFSKDHHCEKDFLAGLSMINESVTDTEVANALGIDISEMRRRLVANADLVLKYLTVRLPDPATSITLKSLDVVDVLFATMLEENSQLSDYEAAAFLPSLVARLGDGKESIRIRVRTALKGAGSIYPSSKIFSALLEHGTKSKNARTRSESVEELGNLLQRQGKSVWQPTKALPALASLIGDKDATCRSAALTALSHAYSILGDVLFQYMQALPDKERTMLDEKLKRSNGVPSPRPNHFSNPSGSSGTPSRPDGRQGTSETRTAIGNRSAGASRLPATAATKRRISSLAQPEHPAFARSASLRESQLPQPRTASSAGSVVPAFSGRLPAAASERVSLPESSHLAPSSPILNISDKDPDQAVDALKRVQRDIAEHADVLSSQTDGLIDAICLALPRAFHELDAEAPQAQLRLCKHLMQTLSAFFDRPALSLAVSKERLVRLLGELTRRLLETSDNAGSEAIASLGKVLNMILIRIFHNSERNACFGALFALLQTSTLDMRDLRGEDLAARAKYAELVMKCVWKVSKTAKESLEDHTLDAKLLLSEVDAFLQAIPPAEWRRRASDSIALGDMPLRTVKTVLQQVVATFGESVYDELALINQSENSFVYQYLYRLLNNSRSAGGVASEPSSRQASKLFRQTNDSLVHVGSDATKSNETTAVSATATPKPPGRMDDTRLNNALKEIFDQIGNAQTSKAGIAELYAFQKEHPEAEARINTWITATGSFFQSYLKRALSNLASEEAERSTPISPTLISSPTASPRSTQEPSASPKPLRLSSSSTAHDERLDNLKRMFS